MGLPIHRFVAATNSNDVVPEYLKSKVFRPRASQQTISNAMDVGNPSNFVRMVELFGKDFDALSKDIKGYAFSDADTQEAMQSVFAKQQYVMDPHGAVGYLGLKKYMAESGEDVTGIFLETAHPAKFKEVVEETLGRTIEIPPALQAFMKGKKKTIRATTRFEAFKALLFGLG